MKDDDDAIAQLSDQLMAISTQLQQLERKQSTSMYKKCCSGNEARFYRQNLDYNGSS
jgi:hypothetical protein